MRTGARADDRPESGRKRLLALLGVVAAVIALPLAVASAGPVGEADQAALRPPAHEDGKRAVPSRPRLLGLGLATAARCGPQLSSGDGIEAQTCVLTQGRDTWARTYYRNATGERLTGVLSFMAPGGRSVEMHCAVDAADDPAVCDTPRQRVAGDMGAYSAVAEFSRSDGGGPLLLRSGSDQVAANGQ
ncbi:hypothetical protein N8I84_20405 [Streptomyces cynarae]|uniref:Secreted protein n=1 Tax=Streptomyces cynarae TaxID=2981134 RepID=A0ABY6EFA7_9ACTN|nr:hypothetical protein [Streptomyces cynarae]UXY24593.1 hypothetical protein N8I84_20405 [Streptomyces cynarae]